MVADMLNLWLKIGGCALPFARASTYGTRRRHCITKE